MEKNTDDLVILEFPGRAKPPAEWRKNLISRCCLVLVISGAVAAGLFARSLSWDYPDYIVTATGPEMIQYLMLCCTAVLLMSVCIAVGLYLQKRNVKAALGFSLAGTVIFFLLALSEGRNVIYELQLLMTGGYAVWCWLTADFCDRHFERYMARAVYIAFGLATLLFNNYSTVYHEFISGRPLAVFYMAAVFSAVYVSVFLKTIKKIHKPDESCEEDKYVIEVTYDPGTIYRARIMCAITVVITAVFSFGRILDIRWGDRISIMGNNAITAWTQYRLQALKAVFSGNYADVGLDIMMMNEVPDFNLIWLGYAFPTGYQLLYIALAIVLAVVMILILIRNREHSTFCVILAGTVLLGNVLGAAAELNLFYGSQMGLLVSQNIYQILPVACLIAVINEQYVDPFTKDETDDDWWNMDNWTESI